MAVQIQYVIKGETWNGTDWPYNNEAHETREMGCFLEPGACILED